MLAVWNSGAGDFFVRFGRVCGCCRRTASAPRQEIHRVKRDLLVLRRTAWPERDAINSLLHEESDVIRPETQVFLRDCYDHDGGVAAG